MVPIYVSDGDFTRADQVGEWEFEFPFAIEGDYKSFIARRPMNVSSGFVRPVGGRTGSAWFGDGSGAFGGRSSTGTSSPMGRRSFDGLGYAYLVDIAPARRIDDFSRIVQYEEVWASVPNRRTTYETISYTEQFLQVTPEMDIIELTKAKTAECVWEYALSPLAQLTAPRLVQIGNSFFSQGQWRIYQPGQRILAEDSANSIYMGRIYQRLSRYVTFTGFTDIGT